MAKLIESWQAEDGETFKTKEEAEAHERDLVIIEELTEFIYENSEALDRNDASILAQHFAASFNISKK